MCRWVCSTVHLYGYLAVKMDDEGNEHRKFIARRFGPYFGKDRYGVIPPKGMAEPTIPKIDRLITEAAPRPDKKESNA